MTVTELPFRDGQRQRPAPPRRHVTFLLVPAEVWRRPDRRWAQRAKLWRLLDAELKQAGRRPLGERISALTVRLTGDGVRLELSCVTAATAPQLAGLHGLARETYLA